MLKASELRIGNFVYAPSGVEKIVYGTSYKTILYTSHLESSTYSEAYDYECEPIPLTEEWLLRFGFVKSNRLDLGELKPCYVIFSLAIMIRHNSFFY